MTGNFLYLLKNSEEKKWVSVTMNFEDQIAAADYLLDQKKKKLIPGLITKMRAPDANGLRSMHLRI